MKIFFTLVGLIIGVVMNAVSAQTDYLLIKTIPSLDINSAGHVDSLSPLKPSPENIFDIQKATSKPTVFSCLGTKFSPDPMLIINGVIHDYSKFRDINQNDVFSITILKDATASAIYGYRAANGVIIITTKAPSVKKFIIKDFLTGQTIPLATICFISESDSMNTMADDNGILVTDKLKAGFKYDVTVSSAGYKTFSTIVKGKEQEILLEKDVKTCSEVIVSSSVISCGRRCLHSFSCKGKDIKADTIPVDRIVSPVNKLSALIYPNPVQRNNRFTIQLENAQNEIVQIAIISLNGSMVSRYSQQINKGLNLLFITADAKWAAGIYNIQLRNEKGTLIRQEKLVVQ